MTKSKKIKNKKAPLRKNPKRNVKGKVLDASVEKPKQDVERPKRNTKGKVLDTSNAKPKHDAEAVDATWLKCRDPELSTDQLNKLTPALKAIEDSKYFQPRFSRAKYYAFAHRVCRAYVAKWVRQDSDCMHINRENLARSAVASVYGQVRPWSDKPHYGNTHMAMLTLLPAIEAVLGIPSYAFKPGSKEWFKKITALNRSVLPQGKLIICSKVAVR